MWRRKIEEILKIVNLHLLAKIFSCNKERFTTKIMKFKNKTGGK